MPMGEGERGAGGEQANASMVYYSVLLVHITDGWVFTSFWATIN